MVQSDRQSLAIGAVAMATALITCDGRMLTSRGMGSIVCYELALSSLNLAELPTGEPDPGEPDVRFGGRGGANQCAIPTPIDGVYEGCSNVEPHSITSAHRAP